MAELTLYYTPTSPYARKVRVFAHEKGVELALTETPPLDDPAALQGSNPLGKVPALITENLGALHDSPVICEYLDTRGDPRLIPEAGEPRFEALRRQALADGVMDAAVAWRIERGRDEALQWDYWQGRYERAISRALDHFESQAGALGEAPLDIGLISLGAALGYLDFRWAELGWRTGRPRLARLAEALFERDSFQATPHPE